MRTNYVTKVMLKDLLVVVKSNEKNSMKNIIASSLCLLNV